MNRRDTNLCEHAESTVLLYLFGEAPRAYTAHLDACADCQTALTEHADTVAWVSPALAPPAEVTAPRGWWLAPALTLAAGLALTLQPSAQSVANTTVQPAVTETRGPDLTWEDPLATELKRLEVDIATLEQKVEASK